MPITERGTAASSERRFPQRSKILLESEWRRRGAEAAQTPARGTVSEGEEAHSM